MALGKGLVRNLIDTSSNDLDEFMNYLAAASNFSLSKRTSA